ncbi:hypothetical protein NP493_993g00043 [Ridgeia piscesae]|uniref:lysozyme n=1 Tax=Ridgeia piscesae TaxID=27915 RepID=A0AAD9KIV4_RIDPI|nr:hypothetical protein NP493_993g00043 [Ridgeia piscesae]
MRGFLVISLSAALVCLGGLDVTTADTKCLQRGGKCQYTFNYCTGAFWSGYCYGASNRRCCIPGSKSGDSSCIKKGGHCMDDRTNSCDGNYQSGYCSGNSHRRCCIEGSGGGRNSGGSGGFSVECMNCICEIEGCSRNLGKCRDDKGSDSCGPFQIKSPYYTDCYKPGSDWRSCTKQMGCSKICVVAYMRRYGNRCARMAGRSQATCQDFARVHNGGPKGCFRTSTLDYWKKILSCCVRVGGC